MKMEVGFSAGVCVHVHAGEVWTTLKKWLFAVRKCFFFFFFFSVVVENVKT